MPHADPSPKRSQHNAATHSGSTVFVIADDVTRHDVVTRQLASMGYAVAAFDSADAYRSQVDSLRTGCVVFDAPSCAAGAVLEQITADSGVARPTVYITDDRDVPTVVQAMHRGAVDVLSRRSYSEADLWEAVQRALTLDVVNRERLRRRQDQRRRIASLTKHERRVLQLLMLGKSNPEIAAECAVSRVAVEGRRSRLMKKIGVTNLPALVRFVVEAGFDADDGASSQAET